MGRHKVKNHTDAALMTGINELAELIGIAIARRNRIVARRLIAPRAIVRILGHRHQLNMRKAHGTDIRQKLILQPRIGIGMVLGIMAPAARMYLINRHRRIFIIVPLQHPALIVPRIVVQIVDLGRIGRRRLTVEGIGIRLVHRPSPIAQNVVLIAVPFLNARHKEREHLRILCPLHDIFPIIPVIETAEYRYLPRMRRKDSEANPLRTLIGKMSAEEIRRLPAGTFMKLAQKSLIVPAAHNSTPSTIRN